MSEHYPLRAPTPWRVGKRVPEHVYCGDGRPLVTMPTAALAARVVAAVNAQPAAPEPSAELVTAMAPADLAKRMVAAESQLAAVRQIVSRLGNSFERTSMYMDEEQRSGKATALSITRMSARKAALEQVLEELRKALTPGAGENGLRLAELEEP